MRYRLSIPMTWVFTILLGSLSSAQERVYVLGEEVTSNGDFGKAVSDIGDVDADGVPDVVVGAPFDTAGGTGSGSIFAYSGKTGDLIWTRTGTYPGDLLGWSLDGMGDVNGDGKGDLIVGAPGHDQGGVWSANGGAAYLISGATGGGGLNALGRHTAAALASADTSIHYAMDVNTVIGLYRDAVGAAAGPETVSSVHGIFADANEAGCPLSNNYEGSPVCYFCFADDKDCPCGNEFPGGGCTNSTGDGGLLTATGSTNYSADDLVLTASNLPANTPVIWIQAPATTRTPLRDGLLCLAPGGLKIIRVDTQSSSDSGVATLGPGIIQMSIDNPVDVAEIFPGDTWYFQAYYRDSASPCGQNANLTNAAQATF